MQCLLVLSGKGGTGKTTVASAFIKIANVKAYADCDVDAPNLHLVMGWDGEPERDDYYGLDVAKIDPDLCVQCDECVESCRFDAISVTDVYAVDPYACEGCGVCERVCPEGAAKLWPAVAGDLILYADGRRTFSTAKLRMGNGTSGKLVSEVKKRLAGAAPKTDFAVIDGSPGIGCPVIASISGVDMVLLVAEPSASGISDLDRIVDTAAKFGTETVVCVNKYDMNLGNTERIEAYCEKRGLPFVGRIPFDPIAVKAINRGKTIVDVDCESGTAVKDVFRRVLGLLSDRGVAKVCGNPTRGNVIEIN